MSTSVQTTGTPQSLQQLVNGITARLAQLAKDPPDLLAYLRVHAESIVGAFQPVGFVYEMRNGTVFQRVLQVNIDSLGLKVFPEQEDAFRRAVLRVADHRKPILLTNSQGGGSQALAVEDSPAPDELPIFNRTPFEQHFVPIPLGNACAGVLHIWFTPAPPQVAQTRSLLLRQICADAEIYLKARQARDHSAEVTRLSTHVRLLEELTGDIDLESVSWNMVNFAREAVNCERACLFIASDYDRPVNEATPLGGGIYDFVLQACSGLKKPNPRSEQAMTLQRVAQKLTEMSLAKAAAAAALPPPAAVNGTGAAPLAKPDREPTPAAPTVAPPGSNRPRPQIVLMIRDPAKTATRAAEINDYFDLMPMNWATVIPLFDRNDRVCGILLFEGIKVEEKLANAMKPMLELGVAAGRTLGTALYCSQHRSMRVARSVVAARQRYVNTPAKRKFLRMGVPLLLLAAALACPFPYRIKGDANIVAVNQNALPALVNARLLDVVVREGETVKQGQALAHFDTQDLRLQLAANEQEQQRSLLESDAALAAGNETQMQMFRLKADQAGATMQKLRSDLEHAVLRAPFDGIVLGAQTLSTRRGEVLRMGETALHVVDPKGWQVKTGLREKDLIFLDERLKQTGPIPAVLRLAADPAQKYELELTSANQLAYGLNTAEGEYEFTAVLPFTMSVDNPTFLKSGFTGRVTFAVGRRPVAYLLFKDFIQYITVRFF